VGEFDKCNLHQRPLGKRIQANNELAPIGAGSLCVWQRWDSALPANVLAAVATRGWNIRFDENQFPRVKRMPASPEAWRAIDSQSWQLYELWLPLFCHSAIFAPVGSIRMDIQPWPGTSSTSRITFAPNAAALLVAL
jgi:hypothetical protein